MPRRAKFTVEQVERALREGGGLFTRAAEWLATSTGSTCSRNTIWRYVHRHDRLKKVIAEIVEGYLDSAEDALLKKVKDGNLGAATFYLRAKGRGRGYASSAAAAPSTKPVGSIDAPEKIEDADEWARAHGGNGGRR